MSLLLALYFLYVVIYCFSSIKNKNRAIHYYLNRYGFDMSVAVSTIHIAKVGKDAQNQEYIDDPSFFSYEPIFRITANVPTITEMPLQWCKFPYRSVNVHHRNINTLRWGHIIFHSHLK